MEQKEPLTKRARLSARWYERWDSFKIKYPKAAKWVYQVAFFYLFSLGVTVFQYLVFTYLPYLLGTDMAGREFMWPQIPMQFAGIEYKWNILGYNTVRDSMGNVVIGGGLGYFISYEVGSFMAQCINFPLQRNITFKSKGKIGKQMLGYLVAWILISLFCNAINGLWLPIAQAHFEPQIYNLLVTFITGGVSMVIYFFTFKKIFPEKKDR